jgi:eukaryotic translation initiation factor 2C
MSNRGGGTQRARGGGKGGANGGGSGMYTATTCYSHTNDFQAHTLSTGLATMSLNPARALAVDGTPLYMDPPVAVPESNPMVNNEFDSALSQKVLKDVNSASLHAEFPLRMSLSQTNTHVDTNHFVVKLDPAVPLYEYSIRGLPPKIAKLTVDILVQDAINRTPFLKENHGKFATEGTTLVSWTKIPDLGPINVRSAEWKSPITIRLEPVGKVNTDLLQRYSGGSVNPTQVRNVHETVAIRWCLQEARFTDIGDQVVEIEIKEVINALNTVVSSVLGKGCFSLRANKFFLAGGHNDLGPSLCAIRGYFYSIVPGTGQVLLRCK